MNRASTALLATLAAALALPLSGLPAHAAPLIRQEVEVETEVEVNVPRPRVEVEIDVPKPYYGPLGRGSWVLVDTIDRSQSVECVFKNDACWVEQYIDVNSLRTHKSITSFRYKFRNRDREKRYTQTMAAFNETNYGDQPGLARCSKGLVRFQGHKKWVKADQTNLSSMFKFVCDL